MMDLELVPIGNLDRKVPIERHLDDLLNRYSKSEFRTFDVIASYDHLLQTFLQVVRRRNKLRRGKRIVYVATVERHYLALITQDTQIEIIRRIRLAKEHLLKGDVTKEQAKAIEELENLERDIPNLSDNDQRNIGATQRAPSVMNQTLNRLLKRNPDITSPEVVEALRDMKGDGIVVDIDDEYVEIDVTAPGSKFRKTKPYKLSAIPAQLSRARNPKK